MFDREDYAKRARGHASQLRIVAEALPDGDGKAGLLGAAETLDDGAEFAESLTEIHIDELFETRGEFVLTGKLKRRLVSPWEVID